MRPRSWSHRLPSQVMKPVGVAVVGAGYWGPNLVRNFRATPAAKLRWVCDLDADRARSVVGDQSAVEVTSALEEVLDDAAVDAVALATPAATHHELGMACLKADKHLLVEKPLTQDLASGAALVAESRSRGLTIMCDHTYCYTSPVIEIRDLLATGGIGSLHYFDSVRINLGLVQSDVNVFWDLAPHDLSILDFILPDGIVVTSAAAHGADPLGVGHACVGYAALRLSSGALAHINVNWLSPTKIRTTIIGGSDKMIVWDDLRPDQRLSIYDSGVDLHEPHEQADRRDRLVSYRIGSMLSPALPEVEALRRVVDEFCNAIHGGRPPATDGESGLRVLAVLSAIEESLKAGGAEVPVEVPA